MRRAAQHFLGPRWDRWTRAHPRLAKLVRLLNTLYKWYRLLRHVVSVLRFVGRYLTTFISISPKDNCKYLSVREHVRKTALLKFGHWTAVVFSYGQPVVLEGKQKSAYLFHDGKPLYYTDSDDGREARIWCMQLSKVRLQELVDGIVAQSETTAKAAEVEEKQVMASENEVADSDSVATTGSWTEVNMSRAGSPARSLNSEGTNDTFYSVTVDDVVDDGLDDWGMSRDGHGGIDEQEAIE